MIRDDEPLLAGNVHSRSVSQCLLCDGHGAASFGDRAPLAGSRNPSWTGSNKVKVGVFAVRVSRPPSTSASQRAKDSPMRTRKSSGEPTATGGPSLVTSMTTASASASAAARTSTSTGPAMPSGMVQERFEDLGGGGFRRTGGTDAGGLADPQWPSCRGERCGPPLPEAG